MPIARGTLGTVSPALDFRNAIESVLPGAGWVKVDAFTRTTPNVLDIVVYRNPAANNSWGTDFYVAIGYRHTANDTVGTAQLIWGMSELYDSTTKLASKAVPVQHSSYGLTVLADGTHNSPAREFCQEGTSAGAVGITVNDARPMAPIQHVAANGTFSVLATKDAIFCFGYGSDVDSRSHTTMIIGRQIPQNSHPSENGLLMFPMGPTHNSNSQGTGGRYHSGGYTRLPNYVPNTSGVNPLSYWCAGYRTDRFTSAADVLQANAPRAGRLTLSENNRTTLRVRLGGGALHLPIGDIPTTDDLSITVDGVTKTYMYIGNSLFVDTAAV